MNQRQIEALSDVFWTAMTAKSNFGAMNFKHTVDRVEGLEITEIRAPYLHNGLNKPYTSIDGRGFIVISYSKDDESKPFEELVEIAKQNTSYFESDFLNEAVVEFMKQTGM